MSELSDLNREYGPDYFGDSAIRQKMADLARLEDDGSDPLLTAIAAQLLREFASSCAFPPGFADQIRREES